MYQTMRCKRCGSENHWTAECPPRERAVTITDGIKRCEVNIMGVTTKYVSKDDYDALVLVHEALQVSAQQELAKVREESQWRWYKDHIEAIQRRYEAELDIYRKPFVPFVPVSSFVFTCLCGAKCSSRENLLSHIRTEAEYRSNVTQKFRDIHVSAAAAFNTLWPA